MSHEQASLVKAWNTLRGREVRPVMGRLGGLVASGPTVRPCALPALQPSPASLTRLRSSLTLPTLPPSLPVQVVSLGRELLGGNGILSEFLVAKAFADMEAYYR